MKQTSTKKILCTTYTDFLREKLRLKNALIAGPLQELTLSFDVNKSSAYTKPGKKKTNSGKIRLKVVIGGGMIRQIVNLPDYFDDREILRKYLPVIVAAFYGVNYHEMGHVKFTDMVSRLIIDYSRQEYIPFLHQLFNITEDYVVEENMVHLVESQFPSETSPKDYFSYLKKQLFVPQADNYEDKGDAMSFLQYILLILRVGKKNIAKPNAVFDKYQADLVPKLLDVLNEEDPTERIRKVISTGEWMIDNITEIDFKWQEMPDDPISGAGAGTGMPAPKKGMSGIGGMSGLAKKGKSKGGGNGHEGDNEDLDFDEEDKEEASKAKSEEDEEEEAENTPEPEDEDEEDEDEEEEEEEILPEEDTGELENEIINDSNFECEHTWVIAKDDYEIVSPEEALNVVENKILTFKDCINDVSKFFSLFKDRIKPRIEEGHTRGKLNIRRAMNDDRINGCDTRLFNQKIKRGMDTSAAVSQLVDLSGSMSGKKSECASTAAAALAQACEWSGIPFECNGFVYSWGYGSTTIQVKGFEDSFEKAKPYFALLDDNYENYFSSELGVSLFSGNQEEDNIYHIWQKLLKRPEKNKLLIVLCDGATCGSRQTLHDLVEEIRKSGVKVIGVGIQSTDVVGIYPETKVFHTMEELQTGLAPYLIEQLEQYTNN